MYREQEWQITCTKCGKKIGNVSVAGRGVVLVEAQCMDCLPDKVNQMNPNDSNALKIERWLKEDINPLDNSRASIMREWTGCLKLVGKEI